MLVKKKKDLSKFLDKAPDIRDLEIQWRLNKLSEINEFFNRGDNNNFFPVKSSTSFLGPPPLPPPSDLFNISNVLRIDEFLNNSDFNSDFSNGYVPPAPDPPLLRGFTGNFFPKDHLRLKLRQTWERIQQTMSGNRLKESLKK